MAGVVGIDIPISRFESFAPRNQLGPLGYTFGINANGFLIFHPNLLAISNYLEDPAHNDLEDIEGDAEEISKLRKAMIDDATKDEESSQKVEKVTIKTSIILNEGHSKTVELDYYYTPIPKTRFS